MAVVQFFTWFALFSMWILLRQLLLTYGTSETSSQAYNDGVDWVGILFSVYNGFAAVIAFFLPVLAKYTNRKITHLIALCIGGLGLISFYFINDPKLLMISMVGIGFAWASILFYALFNSNSFSSFQKNGSLHGYFQFLYCYSANFGS